jgi:hypothetical protein
LGGSVMRMVSALEASSLSEVLEGSSAIRITGSQFYPI